MLSTPWSKATGLRVPIVNAPMGGVAGGRLAAAVTAEDGLADDPDAQGELAAAVAADDRRTAPVDAGQGVGQVTGVAPVAEVVERLCSGAEKLLAGWHLRET